jgi:serine protease Do
MARTLTALFATLALAACGSGKPSVASATEADAGVAPASSPAAIGAPPGQASLTTEPTAAPAPRASSQISDSVEATRRTALVRAAARVSPAVVNVAVLGSAPPSNSPWDAFFFGRQRTAGFGSGVIIRKDGVIITNYHVVKDADSIKVTLPDGRDFNAQLVGSDPVADIAVIRIHGDSLPVAPLGTSKGLLIGEWVVAIGNPFANYFSGAEPSVTAGVVSATDRNIVPSSNPSDNPQGYYLGMIQTDAAINPGNSGGPLVDALGQVIGINASIVSRSGGSEGLGFAIPIDRALRTAEDLLKYGEVRRAWVGLQVQPVEADAWGRTRGVRVARVAPGSPAATAGVKPGDRLMAANGRALSDPLDFRDVMLDLRAGDPLDLRVQGSDHLLRLRAVGLPSATAPRVTALGGIKLVTLTPEIRAERGIRSREGALIVSIPDNLSAQLGLSEGDVLVQINRTRIRTAEDAARALDGAKGSGQVRVYFEQNGSYVERDFYWG